MSSIDAPLEMPGLPSWYRRPDLLMRFIAMSLAVHAVAMAPWARVLTLLFGLLGFHWGSVQWRTDVDHPTVIPIDLASLDDEPAVAKALGDNPGAGVAAIDAGPETTDSAPEGGDGEAGPPAPPPRVKDPNALAGGLSSITPRAGEVNVSLLLRTDHLREHPIGRELGPKLARTRQWRPFFEGTGFDPVRDIDALFAFGPQFANTARVTAIIVHNKPDADLTSALRTLSDNLKGEWFGDDDVPAFRAKIDGYDRVVVQIPSGLIITPDKRGEDQAIAIARALLKKHRSARDLIPKGQPDLYAAWYLRTPFTVMSGVPKDLNDAHITLSRRKDNGLVLDADARAKNAATATDDAEEVRKIAEQMLPGIVRTLFASYLKGHKIEARGDVVHVHHELDLDQVNALWSVLAPRL